MLIAGWVFTSNESTRCFRTGTDIFQPMTLPRTPEVFLSHHFTGTSSRTARWFGQVAGFFSSDHTMRP
jgi:hypothetical protein